jgi:hypothetical protein
MEDLPSDTVTTDQSDDEKVATDNDDRFVNDVTTTYLAALNTACWLFLVI